jgi:hypothetical protein
VLLRDKSGDVKWYESFESILECYWLHFWFRWPMLMLELGKQQLLHLVMIYRGHIEVHMDEQMYIYLI